MKNFALFTPRAAKQKGKVDNPEFYCVRPLEKSSARQAYMPVRQNSHTKPVVTGRPKI
jgi:hypothetical protein